MKKKLSLTKQILFALIVGIVFGIVANAFLPKGFNDNFSKWALVPLGKMFVNAIKMIVVPLVLCSLISGAASIGDIRKLGRVGSKILVYYLLTTALAVILALTIANLVDPGIGTSLKSAAKEFKAVQPPFIMDIFVNMIPTNPIESLVKGEMLQIIFFAIIFGITMTLIGDPVKPLLDTINQINDVLLKIIGLVMLAAPIGVFALISNVIMFQGIGVLLPLMKYALCIVGALILQVVVVYGGSLKVLGRVNPVQFFKKFWPVMTVAFSTSSSNATIPVNLEVCEEQLGIPKSIASFTIPLGATVNMDGTAIMQGVATIFLAQLFGVGLTFQDLIMVVLTATLASIGTAGVPGAGMVMLSMVLLQVGIPVEGIPIILSIDRILDMMRTVVNVTGDAVGTVIVSNMEKELDLDRYNGQTSSNELTV
jgi:Na+/H+-dicarboxylate symporter